MIEKDIKYENSVPQLVKERKDGKRPGYRGDSAYRSGSEQSKTSAGGQGNVGSQASFGGGKGTDTSGRDEGAPGADYSAVTSGPFQDNQDKLDTFKDYRPPVNPPGILSFLKGPLQGFADFTAAKNRPFFEDVIRAGKLKDVNFGTISNMSEAELEQAYQNYLSERLAGNIDAYGNRITPTGGDSPIQNMLLAQQQAAMANPLGDVTTEVPQGGVADLYRRYMQNLGYTI